MIGVVYNKTSVDKYVHLLHNANLEHRIVLPYEVDLSGVSTLVFTDFTGYTSSARFFRAHGCVPLIPPVDAMTALYWDLAERAYKNKCHLLGIGNSAFVVAELIEDTKLMYDGDVHFENTFAQSQYVTETGDFRTTYLEGYLSLSEEELLTRLRQLEKKQKKELQALFNRAV